VTSDGLVRKGAFLLVGPAALFRSEDGAFVGTAEQRLGSLEPTQVAFGTPEDAETAAALVASGKGEFPLDPTLGNAHKIEATNESFVEHVQAGGLVMVPIFAMASLAFLVALYKFLGFLFVRTPSPKKIAALLKSVSLHDTEAVNTQAAELKGPVGDMLRVGVEHLEEPRELIEEVMYESVLKTRLKLNSLLPFIAICAASAPLLGLLGTVTGIINTFKLLTVFGSGDVSNLSGGISEALITTKFGLIVAIPSLLIHAFLWRMAKGMVAKMETAAIAFANEVSRSPYAAAPVANMDQLVVPQQAAAPSEEAVRAQVKETLSEMLSPILEEPKKKASTTTQLS
jgi:biopolymer transport protein ExbB